MSEEIKNSKSRAMRGTVLIQKKHWSSFQIIACGFVLVILAGSILLMLPFATAGGESASFWDALFTATSASCVTGLVVQNTATYWSFFGQFIILLLIQIGGMGVVTMAIIIVVISGRKISLMQRSTMQEAIAAPSVGGIVRLTRFIIQTSIVIEFIGAAVLFPVFIRNHSLPKALWYSLFHAVSAFCNAGFDLLGEQEPFVSLTSYAYHPWVNIVIMLLIIVGGIGFGTWNDVREHKWNFHRYTMQSKVIFLMTALLILLPAVFFFFVDLSQPKWNDISIGGKILNALFQSVTMRTAGFNTLDLAEFSEGGRMIMIILMLIGGAPGSTAGGMKVTTAAVLLISAAAVFQRREEVRCFGRRIAPETVRYGATVLILYLVMSLVGAISISCIEGLPILDCLFEASSAVGTVGLSLGLTPKLSMISRGIIVVLMYVGRVGGLTLVFAAMSRKRPHVSKLPLGKIVVG